MKTQQKQITIKIPITALEQAKVRAATHERPDGLKLTHTAILRTWLLKGMQQDVQQQSK